MEKTKSNIKFSNKHDELGEAVEAALKKVSQNIIEETKKQNSYLVVTDEMETLNKFLQKTCNF